MTANEIAKVIRRARADSMAYSHRASDALEACAQLLVTRGMHNRL